jgi:hypothetical protein
MALFLPFTNDGCRTIAVSTPAGMFSYTTYFMPLLRAWLCDIVDGAGNALITGLALNVLVDNLLKGRGDTLKDYTLRVYSMTGKENNTPDSLGSDCQAVLFLPGETVPDLVGS